MEEKTLHFLKGSFGRAAVDAGDQHSRSIWFAVLTFLLRYFCTLKKSDIYVMQDSGLLFVILNILFYIIYVLYICTVFKKKRVFVYFSAHNDVNPTRTD